MGLAKLNKNATTIRTCLAGLPGLVIPRIGVVRGGLGVGVGSSRRLGVVLVAAVGGVAWRRAEAAISRPRMRTAAGLRRP